MKMDHQQDQQNQPMANEPPAEHKVADIKIKLTILSDALVLQFSQPVEELKLPRAIAMEMGTSLIKQARKIKPAPVSEEERKRQRNRKKQNRKKRR